MASDRMREENRREAAHPRTVALMCTTRVRRARESPVRFVTRNWTTRWSDRGSTPAPDRASGLVL
jgi:hypothetical protein